jgi:hypothetical protein
LLDWAFSPLIAAHFAVEHPEFYNTDGALWCFNHKASNRLLPASLREIAEREGADVFTASMVESAATSLHDFDELGAEPFVLFLEPPSLVPRIVNQFALFSLMSGASLNMTDWVNEHSEMAKRFLIPARFKPDLRGQAGSSGNHGAARVSGLDGIGRWLSRYYRPRLGS